MMRTVIFALALATTSMAAAAAPRFQAEPVAPPVAAKLVLRDTMWKCSGGSCVAGNGGSRPQIVCALLAREVGALKSFTVAGQAMPPEQLEKCNARAR